MLPTCNNVHLSKIEESMRVAVDKGPDAVAALPAASVYMWLSKLFYGILYREHLLMADRRVGKRPIVPKGVLRELRLHHDFMQGICRTVGFPFGVPGSIFIFGTSLPSRIEQQFDFIDNHQNLSIALRMGSVGLVCCLQDGGSTKRFHDHLKHPYHRKSRLHPMQFREATAQIFYKSMLLETSPFFTVVENPNELLVITQNPQHISFRDWNWFTFCKLLAYYWDQPVEEIYGGNIGWASSIRDENRRFRKLDADAHYRFLVPDKWKAQEVPGCP